MKIPNYNNSAKPIFLASILVISIVTLGFLMPSVHAEHPPGFDSVTKSVDAGFDAVTGGDDIFSIRDISNPLDQVDANGDTLSTTSIEIVGKTVTITVTDADANLDSGGIDKVLAKLNSTSFPAGVETELEETGDNTGIFTGTVNIQKGITAGDTLQVKKNDVLGVIYEPEPRGVGRAQFSFGFLFLDLLAGLPDGTETVVMKDVLVANDCPSFPGGINILTYPIELQVPDLLVSNVQVTLSTANAVHGNWPDVPTEKLKIIYKPPGGTWEDLTPADYVKPDIPAGSHIGTITNDDDPLFGAATNLQPSTIPPGGTGDVSGQYAIGLPGGCIGGGGGGLVRPGFVVNALAGANVVSSLFSKGGSLTDFTGGSKNGPAKPIVTSGTVNNLSDEDIGFVQQSEGIGGIISDSDSTSLKKLQNVGIGKDLSFKYNVYENKGPDFLEHATMYFFDAQMMDVNDRIKVENSETYIRFEKGQPVKVVDPYGYFEKANFELSPIDTYNAELKYDITFSKIMPESHIVLRTWDAEKYSTDTMFENALVVNENSIIDNDSPSTNDEPLTQSEFEASPFLDTKYENPLAEEETTTKTGFPGIPLWVKNNAMWWHEKQIDDEDFVAGIKYMVNEEILIIPETQITSSTTEEIPSWISNVAGYWSNDEIPDDQFIQAMQWLISNGLMEI